MPNTLPPWQFSAMPGAPSPAPRPPSFFFTRTRVRSSLAVIAGLMVAGVAARAVVVALTVEDYRAHERVRQDELEAASAEALRAARPTAAIDWERVWRGVLAEELRLRGEDEAAAAAGAGAGAMAVSAAPLR